MKKKKMRHVLTGRENVIERGEGDTREREREEKEI